jgi:YaiO family outer membrane protein
MKRSFLFILLLLACQNVWSQSLGDKYQTAREKAFGGSRGEAVKLLEEIIEVNANHYDARILLAKINSWEKNFDVARNHLLFILKEKETHEALTALIDNEYWAGNYEYALEVLNRAIEKRPSDIDLRIKRIRTYEKLKYIDDAVDEVNAVLKEAPDNQQAISLSRQFAVQRALKMTLSYSGNYFEEKFSPWQNFYVSASKRFSFGSLILRFNYAERFSNNGYQIESDYYFRLVEGTYTYLNLGYSNTKLFPQVRFGLEPYIKLPASFEMSAGIRYLKFGSKNVTMYTGSLGKYMGNYWISFRPFITPKDEKTSFSGSLSIRRYLADANNYLTLQVGIGFVPFENFTEAEFGRVDSRKIGLSYNFNVMHDLLLSAGVSYENEEYLPGRNRKKYGSSLSIQKLF